MLFYEPGCTVHAVPESTPELDSVSVRQGRGDSVTTVQLQMSKADASVNYYQ